MKLQPILLELTKFGMSRDRMNSFVAEACKQSGKPDPGWAQTIGLHWSLCLYFVHDYRLFRDWLASLKLWTEEELSIFDPYICLELAED